ncbi:hypothetical protein MVI27_09820 [Chryseobacterium salipaludis]|uniref:hypothetical protein n=1 Tax=Chryseobacterium TaxID=59732 RepID=UPI001FF27A78|nr:MULTISPECIES: hypothetical protein [Chryseobacterium]MCJ8498558.1 hypothetical protein [Chryseobacterium salipaludis]MCX3297117.1 hypothetical protein [Planobacterium sp. JC490]
MKLDEYFSLEATEQQWVLRYEKKYLNEKTGKESTSRNEWYFNTLSHALNSYADKKAKAAGTVSEAVAILQETLENIKNQLKKM